VKRIAGAWLQRINANFDDSRAIVPLLHGIRTGNEYGERAQQDGSGENQPQDSCRHDGILEHAQVVLLSESFAGGLYFW
jgi:hypothetical protein